MLFSTGILITLVIFTNTLATKTPEKKCYKCYFTEVGSIDLLQNTTTE